MKPWHIDKFISLLANFTLGGHQKLLFLWIRPNSKLEIRIRPTSEIFRIGWGSDRIGFRISENVGYPMQCCSVYAWALSACLCMNTSQKKVMLRKESDARVICVAALYIGFVRFFFVLSVFILLLFVCVNAFFIAFECDVTRASFLLFFALRCVNLCAYV